MRIHQTGSLIFDLAQTRTRLDPNMSTSRTVLKSVRAIAQSEGVGAVVKRSIGSGQLRYVLGLGVAPPSQSGSTDEPSSPP